jgi:uncharacterized protein with HEPN domain
MSNRNQILYIEDILDYICAIQEFVGERYTI